MITRIHEKITTTYHWSFVSIYKLIVQKRSLSYPTLLKLYYHKNNIFLKFYKKNTLYSKN